MATQDEIKKLRLQEYWRIQAECLVKNARADGVIVTIALRNKLPLAMGHYDQVVDVREKRVLAEPRFILEIPAMRDEAGYWTNPAYPDLGEDGDYKGWFAERGLEFVGHALESEGDEHPAYQAYYDHAHHGCEQWRPTPPAGDGWYTISIHDTEDGPYWFWARRA